MIPHFQIGMVRLVRVVEEGEGKDGECLARSEFNSLMHLSDVSYWGLGFTTNMKVKDTESEKTFRRQLPVTIEPGLTMVMLSTNKWSQPSSNPLHKDLINRN